MNGRLVQPFPLSSRPKVAMPVDIAAAAMILCMSARERGTAVMINKLPKTDAFRRLALTTNKQEEEEGTSSSM